MIEELRIKFPSFSSAEELQELFVACKLSMVAYEAPHSTTEKLREALIHPWFTPMEYQLSLEHAPQKMLLMRENHRLFATFCGTQSLDDWLADLATSLSTFPLLPGALVHQGIVLDHPQSEKVTLSRVCKPL